MKSSDVVPERYQYITLDHLPDEHLRGIGKVAAAAAFLEGIVERISWRATRLTNRRGQVFTTHMPMSGRLDAMCAAVHDEFPGADASRRLPKIAKRTKDSILPDRNEIVHSRIFKLEEFDAVFRKTYKARKNRVEKTRAVGIDEYEETAQNILQITNELIDIANDVNDLVGERDGTVPRMFD